MTMTQRSSQTELTPKHVRAARALLAWSQQDLAKAAGVATSTVADFERGQRTPVANNAQAVRSALEGAGVRFLPGGAVIGPPIPHISRYGHSGTPIRWVDAEDLSNWANRMDGAAELPTLIAHLIRATHGPGVHLRFPAGEGIRHPGWDGLTETEAGGVYVPQGGAGWELSVQREGISAKATKDFIKRTETPAPLDPANATFVFVALRHWSGKDDWARDRQRESNWRAVRAYDVADLVHWIEQSPGVGLWLAKRLGKRSDDIRELDSMWVEWSRATKLPLTEDLVLCDRDQDAVEVLRWLRGEPRVLSLQSTTVEEVAAFFHAVLGMLPFEQAEIYRCRSLVAVTANGARSLMNAPTPLIILLAEPEPGLAQVLAGRGHYVLQAYDDRQAGRGGVRVLARPSREGIANALIDSGVEEPRARALARDSARNLAVLRRLAPLAVERLPQWAEVAPPPALLAALLLGGWEEDRASDRSVLADIAGCSAESAMAELAQYVGRSDSPLRKIGAAWRLASPLDAWFLLAQHLTTFHINRFEAAALAVLGSTDPTIGTGLGQRWLAVGGDQPSGYSGILRHGIGQALILLSLWGDKAQVVTGAPGRAAAVVAKLLRHADKCRWRSLSRDLQLLAEAAPKVFLSAIEASLDEDEPPIGALFGTESDGLFESEHLSDLLWALEALAWLPEWMPRVTRILARLDVLDDPPGRYANRPANSLRELHLLWNPQTFASLDQRLAALDQIRFEVGEPAWKLMLGILPKGHDSSTPSPMPKWRDLTVDAVETVTYGLVARGAAAVSDRLLADAGTVASRWSGLLERLADLAPNPEAGISRLEEVEPSIEDTADRMMLWSVLRHILHRHRQHPEAGWSMSTAVLDRLETIYHRFAPHDPVDRIAWLFEPSVELPNPSSADWEAQGREVQAARCDAARELFRGGGTSAILQLARRVSAAGYVGKTLCESGLPDSVLDAILEVALRSDHERERDVGYGLAISLFHERKEPWASGLIASASSQGWGDSALLTLFLALPPRRWTWDQLTAVDSRIEDLYWRQVQVRAIGGDGDDAVFAIRKLIGVSRARAALPLALRPNADSVPTEVLVDVLREASRQTAEANRGADEPTMFQYYVAEALQVLDERNDLEADALVSLEWIYLPILEYSRRPARAILQALSVQPELFIEVLCMVYPASDDGASADEESGASVYDRAASAHARHLLDIWDHIPGTRGDDTIDVGVLEAWIKEARVLAKKVRRVDAADSAIGKMLSASPIGGDGSWPAEAVRDVLDLFRSKSMISGFWTGKVNRRGVTSRMPGDGGTLERQEAASYRAWAKAIELEHPHTAKALHALADSYEDLARREDEDAERLDWEN